MLDNKWETIGFIALLTAIVFMIFIDNAFKSPVYKEQGLKGVIESVWIGIGKQEPNRP